MFCNFNFMFKADFWVCLQEMASFKEVRALQVVPLELVKPMQSSVPARLALSRLELLEKLLEQLGTRNSGFTLDNIMRVLAQLLLFLRR